MQKIDVIEYLPKIMAELSKGILINTKNAFNHKFVEAFKTHFVENL